MIMQLKIKNQRYWIQSANHARARRLKHKHTCIVYLIVKYVCIEVFVYEMRDINLAKPDSS